MTENVKNSPLQSQINLPKVMGLYIYKVSTRIYYGNMHKPNCYIAMLTRMNMQRACKGSLCGEMKERDD